MRRCLLIAVLSLLLSTANFLYADTVTIAWDANPVTDNLIGYWVYRMEVSGDYDKGLGLRLNSTPTSNLIFTDTIPDPSKTYYYVVTAINLKDQLDPSMGIQESEPSNEVRVDPITGDTLAPIVQ